uniref:Zinc finger and BTB domain containing 24 n=1 Tax=Amphiprion percula TaxID=161767 RepID=A0A3P8T8A6_AMPPE
MSKALTPASSLVAFCSDSHKQSILSKFDKLRRRELLCDITLVVEDVHFKAHKALLAASSEYFSLMLTAEDQICQSTYRLDGMAAKMFAAVLEFIYSAQVSVEEAATEQLLATAHLMEVTDKAEAADLMKSKRGRPKKSIGAPGTEQESKVAPCESSEDVQAGDDVESQPKDDADYDPRAHRSRQSKRRVRPPVKYEGFKVGSDAAGSKEPGKRGRKRRYPNTEARCEDCGKVFKNPLFLKIHQRSHTGEKPFQCLVCGKCFTQKHTLLAHQRTHTGEKPFVCSICSKALSTKHSLQEHMNLHEGEKSFNCDKCGKTFTQKTQLKSHYRVHTGKKQNTEQTIQLNHSERLNNHFSAINTNITRPFTCEICGKCFTAKSTLQTHIRIHRGEKPYDCNICNKSFSDSSARRRHVASHSGKKPFTCSFCSLSFTRLDNLKTHTKSHNKERAATAEASSDAADASAAPREEVRNILQLQQYQLPSSSEQEIQLVVTGDVDNINFVPGQDQEISLIGTDGEAAQSTHSRLTLLTQPNVALVAQGDVVDQTPQIHSMGVLQGQMSHQPEQMHVITLTKEAMEHLQAHHGPQQPLQISQRPVQQLQVMHQPIQQLETREQHSQAIHISSQSSQPISISQTSEQISSHHIQGQTFQIQAGTVSYLYTTGLPLES